LVNGTLKDTLADLLQRLSLLSYPAHPFCGDTEYKGKIRDIFCDNGTGAYCGPPTNGDWGNTYRTGPDRGAFTNSDANCLPIISTLKGHIWSNRSWKLVICQHYSGPNEDSVFKNGGFINKGVVLNLAVVTQGDTGTDVRPSTYDATLSENCIFSDLGVMPHLCIVTERDSVTHIG
jgi:hypothetical protein